jgi:hypothetical protein
VEAASVTLGAAEATSGSSVLQIKFAASFGELNVYVSPSDRALLDSVKNARWGSRGSIRLGSVFGVPAGWSVADGVLTILVVMDDETWDLAFSIPAAVLDELERQWAAA